MSLRMGDAWWPLLGDTPGGDRWLRLVQVTPSRGMFAASCGMGSVAVSPGPP